MFSKLKGMLAVIEMTSNLVGVMLGVRLAGHTTPLDFCCGRSFSIRVPA
ncbi:MAG: hypothetical protein WCJ71_08110 [Candidatus Omnitrophota bacterium]